jgi:hypothetical protein
MRRQARGKLFLTKYCPGDLYLSEFLYDDETDQALKINADVRMTEDQLEDAMLYAVSEYKRQIASYQDKLIDFALPLLDKIFR